jgi:hypothetical protein
LFGIWFQRFLRRESNRDLDAEHPKLVVAEYGRVARPVGLALQVAAEIPDDGEAVAVIQAGGGKPRDWKLAASHLRSQDYTWEHRTHLRAARLLQAASGGGPPIPPTDDQEALFRAVKRLEAVSLGEAFAILASEVPALGVLEQQVVTARSEPDWQERDARDRRREIRAQLAQLVGPRASAGSPLIRSDAALSAARAHVMGKAGLLS